MYNTNFNASNPVQTSDEYSFEGADIMKNKKSSFSLSSIIGAVVFGVLVLGVVAANLGSGSSEQAYVTGSNEVANTEVTEQQPVNDAEVEGQVAGVQVAQIKEGDGDGAPSLSCPSNCAGTCNTTPSCSLNNCGGCSLEEAFTKRFVCPGKRNDGCNEFNDIPALGYSGQGSVGLGDLSDPARWCKTVQLDAKGPGGTHAKVAYVGDRGEFCVEDTGCNRDSLDWDCTNASPSPSPSPTPTPTIQCPGKPTATCINNADGTASIRLNWSLNGAPATTKYVVRADHMYGINNQCRNSSQTLVGWYCPAGVASCDPLNVGRTCDDRTVYPTGSTTILSNIERGKLYRVYTQVNPGGCSSLSTDVTCIVLPSPPTSPPPVSPPPVTPPPTLSCNGVCNYGPGVRDLCTAANPTWICYPGEQYPGQTSGQGNCRLATNPEGNPESLLCKDRAVASPTPMGPMCLSIARQVIYSAPNDPNPNAPDVGDQVVFYCGSTATQGQTVSYEFRLQLPNGTIQALSTLSNVGNESAPYTVRDAGQHHAQCRVCVPNGTATPTCQQWEPIPGGVVQGTTSDHTSESADPIDFDRVYDVDSAVHFNSTNASSQQ